MRQRSIADIGRRIAVDTHPFHYASYVLPVPRKSGQAVSTGFCSLVPALTFGLQKLSLFLLQCMSRLKPPCNLLNFQGVTPVIKGLTPS